MNLTDRDLDLLLACVRCVRIMTATQIASGWWSNSLAGQKNAARRISLLVRAALLVRDDVLAHPLLELSTPLHAWEPGNAEPQFLQIAKRAQNRWPAQPRRVTVYVASRRAAQLVGGDVLGRVRNSCQVTHDLHVSEVYVVYRRYRKVSITDWIGEDSADPGSPGEKVPDAQLVRRVGGTYRAIEFAGRYSAQRISDFHRFCQAKQLPYELW